MSALETEWHRMSNLDHLPSDPQAALLGSEHSSTFSAFNGYPCRQPGKSNESAVDRRRSIILLHGLPHLVPLLVTIAIISLNARGVYWQDLGLPNQNAKLQALQYAANAHEMIMAASLIAIVVYQIRSDLSGPKGVPLAFLTAGVAGDELHCLPRGSRIYGNGLLIYMMPPQHLVAKP